MCSPRPPSATHGLLGSSDFNLYAVDQPPRDDLDPPNRRSRDVIADGGQRSGLCGDRFDHWIYAADAALARSCDL